MSKKRIKKAAHGGRRAGAGRKAEIRTNAPFVTYSYSLPEDVGELIESLALSHNRTGSQELLSLLAEASPRIRKILQS